MFIENYIHLRHNALADFKKFVPLIEKTACRKIHIFSANYGKPFRYDIYKRGTIIKYRSKSVKSLQQPAPKKPHTPQKLTALA